LHLQLTEVFVVHRGDRLARLQLVGKGKEAAGRALKLALRDRAPAQARGEITVDSRQ